jgi:S1-C subfamily serine protease
MHTRLNGPTLASRIYQNITNEASHIFPPVEVSEMKRLPPNPARTSWRPSGSHTNVAATGTGFFITDDGYLLTCAHVVKDATRIEVRAGGSTYAALLVQMDAENDIAVLKANGTFKSLPILSSRAVKLGDAVRTLGFPDPGIQGVQPKLTSGEVNSLAGIRDDPRYFQVSMPIQPGNSGGPLVDARGSVVGIITSFLNPTFTYARTRSLPQAVNYAVKSSYALSLLESVPDAKPVTTPSPSTSDPTENVIKRLQEATVLVLVY